MRLRFDRHLGRFWAILVLIVLGACTTTGKFLPSNLPVAEAGAQQVSVRVVSARKTLAIRLEKNLSVNGKQELPSGVYTLRLRDTKPARQQFHLFSKTFRYTEDAQARTYAAAWTGKGYTPKVISFGKCFKSAEGALIDNRSLWISLARVNSMAEAERLKKTLETQGAWAWIQLEVAQPGTGTVEFVNASGQIAARASTPLNLRSTGLVHVEDTDAGFMKSQSKDRAYAGSLELRVGPEGGMDVFDKISVDDYLAGVLPGEMPASWPEEALKAQAVAARSDVLAAQSGKHMLEGFDFCGTEHCRVYGGEGGRRTASDNAVRATQGMVLLAEGRLVPAVFSANCGGWTEDNDTVWSSPQNPALRGASDLVKRSNRVQEYGIANWVAKPPKAYCSDSDNSRWQRRIPAAELEALVNKRYPVGKVRAIELGERGCSGRLKSVKIVGTKGSEIVKKELAIRQVFGGLNSAMFLVKTEGAAGLPTAFVFTGAGRGHGVGLCQDGAKGRALAGQNYQTIIKAYYTAASIKRVD